MKSLNIAVIGATGMVGQKIVEVLEERNFPIEQLYLFSSERSAGKQLTYKDKLITVEELKKDSFDRPIDIALFSAGGSISKEYAPLAEEKGIYVVDNSSAWRMDENVPLIVPEVNAHALKKDHYLIANPNCSTIQSVVALKPLHDKYGIKRIVYSTYQAVSGSGVKGVEDLVNDTTENYPYSIRKSCLPHIDDFLESGFTKEEEKMIFETKKILGDTSIAITATTVRVPILNSHAVNMNIELEKPFQLEDIFSLFKDAPGVLLKDDVKNLIYPLQADADGIDEVLVGRLRVDPSVKNGLHLFCVADNIRKGAATNTVQIAELIAQKFL